MFATNKNDHRTDGGGFCWRFYSLLLSSPLLPKNIYKSLSPPPSPPFILSFWCLSISTFYSQIRLKRRAIFTHLNSHHICLGFIFCNNRKRWLNAAVSIFLFRYANTQTRPQLVKKDTVFVADNKYLVLYRRVGWVILEDLKTIQYTVHCTVYSVHAGRTEKISIVVSNLYPSTQQWVCTMHSYVTLHAYNFGICIV